MGRQVLMPFGKHRGVPLRALPADYLRFLVLQQGIRQPLRGAILIEAMSRGIDPKNPRPAQPTHS